MSKTPKITWNKCFQLIGQFMLNWSLVEAALDNAIAKLLGLRGLQAPIVCSNIQLRDKLFILGAAYQYEILNAADRETLKKLHRKLTTFVKHRNLVAHHVFSPTNDGTAVQFIVIRAKGNLQFPKVFWKERDFVAKIKRMIWFQECLEDVEKLLKKDRLVRALMDSPSSLIGTSPFAGAVAGLLAPQPPNHHTSGSSPATPKKRPRTPQSSGE